MVRFYDIIRTKGKKKAKGKQPETTTQNEGVRLSDSWFFKSRNLDASSKKKVPSRKTSTLELGGYYRN